MKISIITPSFNQGRFIEDAIQSVLAQNYPDVEHIIVDGGSTDDTVERLKKYPQLKWVSEPDEGQSDALNKGFRMATGDVIGWLNCDDFYLPGAFHKVAQVLASDKVDGVYSNVYFCDVNKNIQRIKLSHKPIKMLSVFHSYVPSETLFFSRAVIDQQKFIDKDFHLTMDKEFVAKILYSNFRLRYVNDAFAVFRYHDANKSFSSKNYKYIKSMEGLNILNRYWKTKLPVNKFTVGCYRFIAMAILPYKKLLGGLIR